MMIIIEGASDHSMQSGGEEIDVYGYQTENFHICPGAKESFEKLVKAGYRGEEMEKVSNMAMLVDDYLGLEIHILKNGANQENIREMIDKGNAVMFYVGCLAEKIQDETIIRLFDFMPDHLLVAMGMKDNEFNDMQPMQDQSC